MIRAVCTQQVDEDSMDALCGIDLTQLHILQRQCGATVRIVTGTFTVMKDETLQSCVMAIHAGDNSDLSD